MSSEITVPYKTDHVMAERKFTVYRTNHGPIVREANGKWVSFRIMQEHIKALEQSYLRTKARSYKAYRETMELKANSSNNTEAKFPALSAKKPTMLLSARTLVPRPTKPRNSALPPSANSNLKNF